MRPSVPDVHITDPQDAELAAYRALVRQAVLGLILGLLAPLAMVDPMLWAIPAAGTIFSWWALRRIKNDAAAFRPEDRAGRFDRFRCCSWPQRPPTGWSTAG